jgi:predicted protein tyrosine phosphatase
MNRSRPGSTTANAFPAGACPGGPVAKRKCTMPNKSIPTVESVFAQYQQLNALERNEFLRKTHLPVAADHLLKAIEILMETERRLKANARKKTKAALEAIAVLLDKLYPRAADYVQWEEWHTGEEKLSYPNIAARHERLTGEPVESETVRKGIKRLNMIRKELT